MKNILAIIPARFASSRFPGKPLVDIEGKPMIQRVYEQAKKAIEQVVVATDDERIFQAVRNFGGQSLMTSMDHQSGTDRCAEAMELFQKESGNRIEIIINIQGDEPFIHHEQIEALLSCFNDRNTEIATLIKPVEEVSVIHDPNRPKVVVDTKGFAIYFSRSPIPYVRELDTKNWLTRHPFYHHIGLYGYRSKVLAEITKLKPSQLELAESLEQLRWLEHGYRIKTALTKHDAFGIDTPEDLNQALKEGLLNSQAE